MPSRITVIALSLTLVSCAAPISTKDSTNGQATPKQGNAKVLSRTDMVGAYPSPTFDLPDESVVIEPDKFYLTNPNITLHAPPGQKAPTPEVDRESRARDLALHIKRGYIKADHKPIQPTNNYRVSQAIPCPWASDKPDESRWHYGTGIRSNLPYTNTYGLYWLSGYQPNQAVSPNTSLNSPTAKLPNRGALECGIAVRAEANGSISRYYHVTLHYPSGYQAEIVKVDITSAANEKAWSDKYVKTYPDGSRRYAQILEYRNTDNGCSAWLWNFYTGKWEWKASTTNLSKIETTDGWVFSELVHNRTSCPTVSRGVSAYDIQFGNGSGWSYVDLTRGYLTGSACGVNCDYSKGMVSNYSWWWTF